jgi:WYL domain
MGNQTNEKQWAAAERLRHIERCAFWRGSINRSDLQRLYDLSSAQASSDLQRYAELNPGALVYNLNLKRYEGTAAMRPVLHVPRLEEAIEMFLGADLRAARPVGAGPVNKSTDQVATVVVPQRSASLEAQRAVFQAVLLVRQVRIRYASFSQRGESWRIIAPHALAHDGYRWHARAWCFENNDFRNYVLGRILKAASPKPLASGLAGDRMWNAWTVLKLRPRRGLSAAQTRAVRLEFGMTGASLTLRVRQAMLDATLMHLRLPPADGRKILPMLEVVGAEPRRSS